MLTNTSGKSEKMTDSKIYIDTAIFIYYLEQNQFYFNKTRNFFKLCFNNDNIGLFTSAVTIEEYCVFPVSENNAESIENFDKFIDGMDSSKQNNCFRSSQIQSEIQRHKSVGCNTSCNGIHIRMFVICHQ